MPNFIEVGGSKITAVQAAESTLKHTLEMERIANDPPCVRLPTTTLAVRRLLQRPFHSRIGLQAYSWVPVSLSLTGIIENR